MNRRSKMARGEKLSFPRNLLFPTSVFIVLAATFVLSIPTQPAEKWRRSLEGSYRQPKTMNMTMGMSIFKDMIQNGVPFRPVPPPFPSLKNLFKVNGTHLTWVPLGSLLFSNNGKIIGG